MQVQYFEVWLVLVICVGYDTPLFFALMYRGNGPSETVGGS
jgi:hypothetical protein